uniref:Uncharacterized protein n=1 Tax=Anguilla anguilla TaxID=7936 RepID=A0A0E9S066_ANGAN
MAQFLSLPCDSVALLAHHNSQVHLHSKVKKEKTQKSMCILSNCGRTGLTRPNFTVQQ